MELRDYRIVSGTSGAAVSGSIDKIFAMGASTTVATLARVEFGPGVMSGNDTNFSASSVIEDIDVAGGSYVHGPIGRAKCGTAGAFLFYLRR